MGRSVLGAIAALLLAGAGLFWWQGRASVEERPPANAFTPPPPEDLPEGDADAIGDAPPMPPEASPQDREARRFARYDRNRDGAITRIEMMGSRARAFKKLDTDGNNLLSFEEWAVATSDRFSGADANGDGRLTPAEFATTAPPRKPACKC
ncbi:EF-hand domain-containing protein [Sphingobium sp. H39-3-25]|uniref:EF-hand domain-containing protein n=1 Tax=Sphingobium arseniciresistens TaxID=3030834 RepID=UPI0023B8FA93|nr:EF-hand domain-containing protein [Sphingobium arseniciresistens]